jgi:nucleoside-diphosphate-sugar epimerase
MIVPEEGAFLTHVLTSFIGSVLVSKLISAGHTVVGSTCSDKGAEALKEAGQRCIVVSSKISTACAPLQR